MTSKYQASLSTQAIARRFSGPITLAVALALPGCTDSGTPTSAGELASRMQTVEASQVAPTGVNVQIDKETLPPDLPATTMVFVFLRTPGESMPLAVEYFTTADVPDSIPFNVEASDRTLEVVARLATDGRVEKSTESIDVSTQVLSAHPPVTVRIDFLHQAAEAIPHSLENLAMN